MTGKSSFGREGDQPVVLMAAYTNYLRDPRVRREAEALTSAGYRVVMLASQQPGQPKRQVIDGVEAISLWRLGHQKTSMLSTSLTTCCSSASLWCICCAIPAPTR